MPLKPLKEVVEPVNKATDELFKKWEVEAFKNITESSIEEFQQVDYFSTEFLNEQPITAYNETEADLMIFGEAEF